MIRAVTATLIVASVAVTAAQSPVFRAGTESVAISATVKRGNLPITNLSASDFQLVDEGVPQTVSVVTIESVPLDVTLFVDTSGSTGGALDQMKASVRKIGAMLRPEDRVRVLTIGLSVETTVPWQNGQRTLSLDAKPLFGISLVYDALFVALAHTPDAGRRHLVVALTDGHDCGSLLDGQRMLDVAGRSEAVLHWIEIEARGAFAQGEVAAWCSPLDSGAIDYVGRAATQSGGAIHHAVFGDPTVKTFATILSDFRQSYVLRYSPTGVTRPGWHSVRVTTPAYHDANITARTGYFSSISN